MAALASSGSGLQGDRINSAILLKRILQRLALNGHSGMPAKVRYRGQSGRNRRSLPMFRATMKPVAEPDRVIR
jgi:hypothetical protein